MSVLFSLIYSVSYCCVCYCTSLTNICVFMNCSNKDISDKLFYMGTNMWIVYDLIWKWISYKTSRRNLQLWAGNFGCLSSEPWTMPAKQCMNLWQNIMLTNYSVFTVRSSYASAVLRIVILFACTSSVCPCHACFVMKRKNILPIFW